MKILFFLRSIKVGGVEKVTAVLANAFSKENEIFILYTDTIDDIMRSNFSNNIKFIKYQNSFFDLFFTFKNIIKKEQIDIVINQWGIQFYYLLLFRLSFCKKIRIISVFHNRPGQNGMLNNAIKNKRNSKTLFKKLYFKIHLHVVSIIVRLSTILSYHLSDKYVVLSESYINEMNRICNKTKMKKLIAIPNPITIKEDADISKKQNIILYVGRLENEQKCVYRILDIWEQISQNALDWQLIFVGDGPEKKNMEKIIKDKKIQRVILVGYENPEPYYQKAKILCLTSDFEGFPLVLCESMNYNVVPVVYNSFGALEDIIDDNINGRIVNPIRNGFDLSQYRSVLVKTMNSDLIKMGEEAKKKSLNYELPKIIEIWNNLFKELHNA